MMKAFVVFALLTISLNMVPVEGYFPGLAWYLTPKERAEQAEQEKREIMEDKSAKTWKDFPVGNNIFTRFFSIFNLKILISVSGFLGSLCFKLYYMFPMEKWYRDNCDLIAQGILKV